MSTTVHNRRDAVYSLILVKLTAYSNKQKVNNTQKSAGESKVATKNVI